MEERPNQVKNAGKNEHCVLSLQNPSLAGKHAENDLNLVPRGVGYRQARRGIRCSFQVEVQSLHLSGGGDSENTNDKRACVVYAGAQCV